MISSYCKEDGGIFFDPSDKEIIDYYLARKLRGETSKNDFILDKDVYAKEPWLLDHTDYSFFMEDEWYYFTTRTQISEKKLGRGKNSKRRITGGDNDGCGSWKPNTTDDIIDKETTKIIGTKKTLTFTKSSDSSWIMTEYMLPEEDDKFQELVLCKIHKIDKSKKKKDDLHGPSEEGNMKVMDAGSRRRRLD
ncbi:NAC domain-containing protein 35 [Eutrema salsugineum]|uniref:NAC domain-containing protein 35 n=1 Tax=Eutrema salsugineum TaxID=72664 RepID=UPI000CED2464|nr:NAC domain-containing protein 35 [Eutrema salsugineum]